MQKTELRQAMMAKLQEIPAQNKLAAGTKIASQACDYLKQHIKSPQSATVGIFKSFKDEINTQPINSALAQLGFTLAYPKWGDGQMHYEDALGQTIVPDAIAVPGIAFDRFNNRLGRGKGYYDQYLAKIKAAGHNPLLIGICFDFQKLALIPTEPHDQKLDQIITD